MNRSRFHVATPQIVRFFDGLPLKIHRRSDIAEYLSQQRSHWRLSEPTTTQKFIELLVKSGRLVEINFPFPAPYRREIRYVWGDVSIYEVMQAIKPKCYFSYHTAVKFHSLTEQTPKTTYLTVEQANSSLSSGEMSQNSIDRAFQGKPRVSANVAKTKNYALCIVAGRNTSDLGVVEKAVVPGVKPLRLTNLERTLIDITVRPIYAGGVFEVAKAFELAKDTLSVKELTKMLQKLKYIYPYHQAVGFYLERAGYQSHEMDLLRKLPMDFDFHLTHKMGETNFIKPWRLHIPKGF
jgi:predicted transcriptional regulator of viral defense system